MRLQIAVNEYSARKTSGIFALGKATMSGLSGTAQKPRATSTGLCDSSNKELDIPDKINSPASRQENSSIHSRGEN